MLKVAAPLLLQKTFLVKNENSRLNIHLCKAAMGGGIP